MAAPRLSPIAQNITQIFNAGFASVVEAYLKCYFALNSIWKIFRFILLQKPSFTIKTSKNMAAQRFI